MGARQRLNSIHVMGSLAVAAVVGGLFSSWTVFLITAGLLIGGSLYVGEIRPSKDRRRH